MAVMAREAWTDERLDDLRDDMNRRFTEVKGEIRDLRGHTDKGFAEVKGEIRDLRVEVAAMQRTMVIGFVSLFASIVVSVLGATLVTQL